MRWCVLCVLDHPRLVQYSNNIRKSNGQEWVLYYVSAPCLLKLMRILLIFRGEYSYLCRGWIVTVFINRCFFWIMGIVLTVVGCDNRQHSRGLAYAVCRGSMVRWLQ